MRSGIIVAGSLAAVAFLLPVTRTVHTVIGDAQIVYALALVTLLVRQAGRGSAPNPTGAAGPKSPMNGGLGPSAPAGPGQSPGLQA